MAHPIQDRTDEEMRALADAAVDEVVATITQADRAAAGAQTGVCWCSTSFQSPSWRT